MLEFMNITKSLADENRVRALLALKGRELCVCQLIELLELAPSTVSKHMSILRQAHLVAGRKNGRWMYYRLADDLGSPDIKEALKWLSRSLTNDPQVQKDARRLKEILKIDPKELCRS